MLGGLLFILLIGMFFLGIFQLIASVVMLIATDSQEVRGHVGQYWVGVLAYFVVLVMLSIVAEYPIGQMLLIAHFFISALLLAKYNFWIMWNKGRIEKEERARRKKQKSLKDPFFPAAHPA